MKRDKVEKEKKKKLDVFSAPNAQELVIQSKFNNIAKQARHTITKDNLDFGRSDAILVLVLLLLIFTHILFGLIQVFFFLNQGWFFYR